MTSRYVAVVSCCVIIFCVGSLTWYLYYNGTWKVFFVFALNTDSMLAQLFLRVFQWVGANFTKVTA